MIANLYGPVPGRRHDSYMLQESELLDKLTNHLGDHPMYLYADSGYALHRHIITPHLGNHLSEEQKLFNLTMSKLRVSVEWEFGDLDRQFAFIDFKKNLKIFLQPVAKYYFVAAILKNCQNCLYQCQTSKYFDLKPPKLEEYLRNQSI